MVATRASTGHSKPRNFNDVSTSPERKRKTAVSRVTKPKPATKTSRTKNTTSTKKATGTKKSTTGAGVTKSQAPNTKNKRKVQLKDKLEAVVEKAGATVTRKPGKKAAGTMKTRATPAKKSKTAK